MEEKEHQINFIIDLIELKNHNLKNQSLSIQEGISVQNNTLYTILDTLVAHFMDKYKINYKELQAKFYKRFDDIYTPSKS